jgi:maltooligosyltrehalose trehalohydrolase
MVQRHHGPDVLPDGARFSIWAPRLQRVSVRLGEREQELERSGEGWWSALVPGAREGDRYLFVLPDGRALPDPASRRQPDGVHGASQIWDARRHTWRHPARGLPLEELVFYELHVGTFTREGTLDAAAARLPDLVELGVTCVELMPLQPFAGSRNWGYDGVALHAVHEDYGGPDALQRFVDDAHGLGLTVCLDLVYNHLGPEGNYLSAFGSYFTNSHKTPWGDGVNYDGEGSAAVRAFVDQAVLQWLRDFRVDALRLDAVHAILDDSPRHLVAEVCEVAAALARREGRHIHVIAESDLEDRKVVDPPPRGWGCSTMWSDDFHHALHALLTGERNRHYADFGGMAPLARALREGFAFQGEHSAYRGKAWGTSTAGLAPSRFVCAVQNHDQVGNRPAGERLSRLVPRAALMPLATLLGLGPGLPLLFMGEEYGEERPFLYFTSHGDPALARAVGEGRKAEFTAEAGGVVPDPQAEDTFTSSIVTHRRDGHHGELWRHHRAMLRLRRRHVSTIGTSWPEVSVDGTVIALRRPGLIVTVNVGPGPAAGLPGWGWAIREGT